MWPRPPPGTGSGCTCQCQVLVSNRSVTSSVFLPAYSVTGEILYAEISDVDDDQDGQGHQTGGLHSISGLEKVSRVCVVPSLDQVDQRGDDGPGGVEGVSIQSEPIDNPPGEKTLVTFEHLGEGVDIPGQDGGGSHVGDSDEEQPGGGESQQPIVLD